MDSASDAYVSDPFFQRASGKKVTGGKSPVIKTESTLVRGRALSQDSDKPGSLPD